MPGQDTSSSSLLKYFDILRLLGKYLNAIAKLVAEMRALRTKKRSNMGRKCRLATLAQLYRMKQEDEMRLEQTVSTNSENEPPKIAFPQERKPEQNGWMDVCVSDLLQEENSDVNEATSLDDLDSSERGQLLAENERLYSKSLQVDNDIQKLESQMTELHRLQETFAEKVTEQDKDICFVNETTILTAENIRVGNEQIRLAIQNMASRRVIFLFCIIVLTFTLLFLDWYNP
ncbi:unnamed protein product [Gongylonema pulchrum]|uniref:Syntaxin-18 n=1 Tax=Gongylonema pulchrum TaxID=637853 RepID=A0A183E781_9BILA|nr:unnamed protein product [Gongylonema pulchrum]